MFIFALKRRNITVAVILFLLPVAVFFAVRFLGEPDVYINGDTAAVAVTAITYFDGITENVFDELYSPIGLAAAGSSLVVADSMGDRIQILNAGGNVQIGLPGRFGLSYREAGAFIDGFREHAMFMKPAGVFVKDNGDILVSDTGNHAIRLITESFVITIAGNGTSGFMDGAETMARFNHPRAAVVCGDGYIYVADTLNHVLRRIDRNGYVSLFAGIPLESGFYDGPLAEARFFEPSGLYITDGGVLYVADAANHAIRRVENGIVTTVAGRPGEPLRFSDYFEGAHKDGPNDEARFNFPRDVALLPDGSVLVADSLNHSIRLITQEGTRTILGGGAAGRFYHSAENLRFTRPKGVATDGETLFISDTMNNRVLAVPLSERVLAGRPSRSQMLADTGLTIDSRFAFRGDIRVFLGERRVDMGRVQPWLSGDTVFVPLRPFLEAMGAGVYLDELTGELSIYIGDTVTTLVKDVGYFILRGVMVTTLGEITRLFPYTVEWFPELSLITMFVPRDLDLLRE